MIERLVRALRGMGIEPTWDQVADLIWLAERMGTVAPVETAPEPAPPAVAIGTEGSKPLEDRESVVPPPAKPTKEAVGEQPAGLYPSLPVDSGVLSGARGARSLRIAGVSPLPGPLEIERALRPLMRKVPSRTAFVIDEEATAKRIAEEGFFLPALRAEPMRWLRVALVVDQAASLAIWEPTLAAFRRLLERHGAFRDVRAWGLDAEGPGPPRLRAGIGQNAKARPARRPDELIDPEGRRLILVVSDCTAAGWNDGSVAELIDRWGQSGPVAVVQVLPPRFWARSALGSERMRLHALVPGVPNQKLCSSGDGARPDRKPVPIITLDDTALRPWARMVAGARDGWSAGALLPTRADRAERIALDELLMGEPDDLSLATKSPTAEEQVRAFHAGASGLARKLADYLCAVSPFNLPVMRLVARAMLTGARPVHLAEVFLSGLLEELPHQSSNPHPDEVLYDFVKGVRNVLYPALLVSEVVMLLHQVSEVVSVQTGSPFDFPALIADPDSTEPLAIPEGSRPFAQMVADSLRLLGRPFAKVVARLEQGLAPSDVTPVPVVVPEGVTAVRILEANHGPITALAWSADGQRLAAVSSDDTVCLWDPGTGLLLHELTADDIRTIAWSSRGLFASCSGTGWVCVWDVLASTDRAGLFSSLETFRRDEESIISLAWSPDGEQVAVAAGSYFAQIQVHANLAPSIFRPIRNGGRVVSLAWPSARCEVLVSDDVDKEFRIQEPDGTLIQELSWDFVKINATARSTDGNILAAACDDGIIRLWNLRKTALAGDSGA